MPQLTNIKAAQAQRGQSVVITLSAAESSVLEDLPIGASCELDSNGKQGTINQVDVFGHSFKIQPQYPTGNFSDETSILSAAQTITITT